VITAASIFALIYIALAMGGLPGLRIDRTGAVLIGATLMLLTHSISFDEAYQEIHYRTLLLLFGMMVVVAQLRLSGFFGWVAVKVVELACGPYQLLACVIFISGVLSAFFVKYGLPDGHTFGSCYLQTNTLSAPSVFVGCCYFRQHRKSRHDYRKSSKHTHWILLAHFVHRILCHTGSDCRYWITT
jgi:hypothetical protein